MTSTLALGVITGEYAHDSALAHTRSVDWKRPDVPREAFKQDLLYSFGAFMTICNVSRNGAYARVQKVMLGGVDPGAIAAVGQPAQAPQAEQLTEAEDVPVDIEGLADQQIIARIKSEFAGHGLAALVGELLTAQGYEVRVSPPGPDSGIDILAANGPLGLGNQRICVQVKSGDGPADNNVVMTLIGAMTSVNATHGLLVSLAGATAPAQKTLDAKFFDVRFWQMPQLLNALQESYHKLSSETRAKLPLKQIWITVSEEES